VNSVAFLAVFCLVQASNGTVNGVFCPVFSSSYWTLFSFFASQTLHNRKNFKKKSGDVNDEANFSFFILLHKRAKPILPSYLLPHLRARTQTNTSTPSLVRRRRRRILLPCFANAKPLPEAHPQTIPPPIDCGRRRRRRTSPN
jgi:hypothetical protein